MLIYSVVTRTVSFSEQGEAGKHTCNAGHTAYVLAHTPVCALAQKLSELILGFSQPGSYSRRGETKI